MYINTLSYWLLILLFFYLLGIMFPSSFYDIHWRSFKGDIFFCVQVYKQKVKHLLYEHQNNISELKAEGSVALKQAQDGHNGSEMELRKDKRALKVELKEQELAHEDVIKNLKKVSHRIMSVFYYQKGRAISIISTKWNWIKNQYMSTSKGNLLPTSVMNSIRDAVNFEINVIILYLLNV